MSSNDLKMRISLKFGGGGYKGNTKQNKQVDELVAHNSDHTTPEDV